MVPGQVYQFKFQNVISYSCYCSSYSFKCIRIDCIPVLYPLCILKQLTSRIYYKIIKYKYFKISLQIFKLVVRQKKPTYFHFFALKTDNSLFCHRYIPTIHIGYCVSNTVDYAKKNDVLPTIWSTELGVSNNRFLH